MQAAHLVDFSGPGPPVSAILIGACVLCVGYGTLRGKGKIIRRFPGLTDAQQGLVLVASGLMLLIYGLVAGLVSLIWIAERNGFLEPAGFLGQQKARGVPGPSRPWIC